MLGLLSLPATLEQRAQANELQQALTILQQADSSADADQSSNANSWTRVATASLNDLATVLAALDDIDVGEEILGSPAVGDKALYLRGTSSVFKIK